MNTLHTLLSGFALGLAGSLHCVGMCGPLSLALPVQHLNHAKRTAAILLYNAGRVCTYSLVGLLFGLMGRGIYLAGLQRWFSVLLGCCMLLLAVQYFVAGRPVQLKWLWPLYARIQQWMAGFIHAKNLHGFFLLGLGNGLLPCGMVYLALAAALNSNGAGGAVLFMGAFGTGTLPAMLLLAFFGMRLGLAFRMRLKKVLPYIAVCMGALLIWRGFHAGIPAAGALPGYDHGAVISCH